MTKGLFEIGLNMLFSELYKIMVNKVTFAGFRGDDFPLDPPLSLTLHTTMKLKLVSSK